MANYNKVILVGNLTRDPQLRYLPSQMPVVEFGLAVSRKFKTQAGEQREDTAFVECSAFARIAEIINQYCRKGNMLFVEGRLKYDTWEDKQGGGKRSKLSVVVENMQLMPRGAGAPGGGGGMPDQGNPSYGDDQRSAPPTPSRGPAPSRQAPPPQQQPEPPFGEEQAFQEDDIPF
jgi:single-strand DNA-binding protein